MMGTFATSSASCPQPIFPATSKALNTSPASRDRAATSVSGKPANQRIIFCGGAQTASQMILFPEAHASLLHLFLKSHGDRANHVIKRVCSPHWNAAQQT